MKSPAERGSVAGSSVVILGALLAAAACRSPGTVPAQFDEARLVEGARTVERRERFVLFSPYGAAATTALADRVQTRVERVQRLFGDGDPRPLTLYLRPVEERDQDPTDPLGAQRPSLDGLRGATVDRRFAVLFVPPPDEDGDVSPAFVLPWEEQTLVHELAHLCLYRVGIEGPVWLHEGLAEEVESMAFFRPEALVPDPLPPELLAARCAQEPIDLAALVRWEASDLNQPPHATERRWRCQALARFLMQRSGASDWGEAVRRTAALPARDVEALEPAFREWLLALDPLGRVQELADSVEPSERALAASLLSLYAERDPQALGTPAADTLALGLLEHPECKARASSFLVFFAARRLSPGAIERLQSSGDPVQELTALAIRARRGEPVDLDHARSVEAGLSPEQRQQASIAVYLLLSGARSP